VLAMKNLSQFSNFAEPVFQRERANLIFGYIEGYRATGDPKWLGELQKIVRHTAGPSITKWVTTPAAYGSENPGSYVRTFQFNQVVWSLGRYLDFCKEYGIADELNVAKVITSLGDFMLKHAMKEYEPDRAAVRRAIWRGSGWRSAEHSF